MAYIGNVGYHGPSSNLNIKNELSLENVNSDFIAKEYKYYVLSDNNDNDVIRCVLPIDPLNGVWFNIHCKHNVNIILKYNGMDSILSKNEDVNININNKNIKLVYNFGNWEIFDNSILNENFGMTGEIKLSGNVENNVITINNNTSNYTLAHPYNYYYVNKPNEIVYIDLPLNPIDGQWFNVYNKQSNHVVLKNDGVNTILDKLEDLKFNIDHKNIKLIFLDGNWEIIESSVIDHSIGNNDEIVVINNETINVINIDNLTFNNVTRFDRFGYYFINKPDQIVYLDLPQNPINGDWFNVYNKDSDKVIVRNSGQYTIHDSYSDFEIDINKTSIQFIFNNDNWEIFDNSIANNVITSSNQYDPKLNIRNINSNFTASNFNHYFIDSPNKVITCTLPPSPSNGDWFSVYNRSTKKTVIKYDGNHSIFKYYSDFELDVDDSSIKLIFNNGNWELFDTTLVGNVIGGNIDHQASVVNIHNNFTAAKYNYYFIDAPYKTISCNLPASPSNGDWFNIYNKDSNKIVINYNGNSIYGNNNNFELDTNNTSIKLLFNNGNWELFDNSLIGNIIGGSGNTRLDVINVDSDFNISNFTYYFVDSPNTIINCELPSNPMTGDWFSIYNRDSLKTIIKYNGNHTIYKNSNDFELDTNNASIRFIFNNGNWELFDDTIFGSIINGVGESANIKHDIVNITSDFTANYYKYYFIEAPNKNVICNLPLNPSSGDWFNIYNKKSKKTTIKYNGNSIYGKHDDFELDVENSSIKLLFNNGNWEIFDTTLTGSIIDTGNSSGSKLIDIVNVSSHFNANSFNYYFINSSNNVINCNLPTNPTIGEWVNIYNKNANKVVINYNGIDTIYGSNSNFELDIQNSSIKLLFNNGNWEIFDTTLNGSVVGNVSTEVVDNTLNIINIGTNFIADKFKYYFVNANNTNINCTLPDDPINGEWFNIYNKNSNKVVIKYNSKHSIYGSFKDFELDTINASIKLIFNTGNWEIFDTTLTGSVIDSNAVLSGPDNNEYNIINVNDDFNITNFNYYFVDSPNNTVKCNIPNNPSNGDWFSIYNKDSEKIIVQYNGVHSIYGHLGNFEIDVNDVNIKFVFNNDNWEIFNNTLSGSLIEDANGALGKSDIEIQIKSNNFTVSDGICYYVDTSSNSVDVNLPTDVDDGFWFIVSDKNGTFNTNSLYIRNNNVSTIINTSKTLQIDKQNAKLKFIYIDNNWDILDLSIL